MCKYFILLGNFWHKNILQVSKMVWSHHSSCLWPLIWLLKVFQVSPSTTIVDKNCIYCSGGLGKCSGTSKEESLKNKKIQEENGPSKQVEKL